MMIAMALDIVIQHRLYMDTTPNHQKARTLIFGRYRVSSRMYGVNLEQTAALIGMARHPMARSATVCDNMNKAVLSSRSSGYRVSTTITSVFTVKFNTIIAPIIAGLASLYSATYVVSSLGSIPDSGLFSFLIQSHDDYEAIVPLRELIGYDMTYTCSFPILGMRLSAVKIRQPASSGNVKQTAN